MGRHEGCLDEELGSMPAATHDGEGFASLPWHSSPPVASPRPLPRPERRAAPGPGQLSARGPCSPVVVSAEKRCGRDFGKAAVETSEGLH